MRKKQIEFVSEQITLAVIATVVCSAFLVTLTCLFVCVCVCVRSPQACSVSLNLSLKASLRLNLVAFAALRMSNSVASLCDLEFHIIMRVTILFNFHVCFVAFEHQGSVYFKEY